MSYILSLFLFHQKDIKNQSNIKFPMKIYSNINISTGTTTLRGSWLSLQFFTSSVLATFFQFFIQSTFRSVLNWLLCPILGLLIAYFLHLCMKIFLASSCLPFCSTCSIFFNLCTIKQILLGKTKEKTLLLFEYK